MEALGALEFQRGGAYVGLEKLKAGAGWLLGGAILQEDIEPRLAISTTSIKCRMVTAQDTASHSHTQPRYNANALLTGQKKLSVHSPRS